MVSGLTNGSVIPVVAVVQAGHRPWPIKVSLRAEEPEEDVAKLAPPEAVEEKVGAGVDAQHGVAGYQEEREERVIVRELHNLGHVVDGGNQAAHEEAGGYPQDDQSYPIFQICGSGEVLLWIQNKLVLQTLLIDYT